jgi:hypothetical protein
VPFLKNRHIQLIGARRTSFMVNKAPPKVHNRGIRIKIDDTHIKQVKTQKYLGIMLSWIWMHKLSHSKIKRQFLSTHGIFCRIITKAYQSVSTDAAQVLAGLAPIDIELERIHCHHELRTGRSAFFQGELITNNTFLHPRHLDEYLRLKTEDIWQERWEQSSKGRTTYKFIPLCSPSTKNRQRRYRTLSKVRRRPG